MRRDGVGNYRDTEGVQHRLVVRRTGERGWEVLDVDETDARVVERLTDDRDGRPQADAIARDYLATASGRATDTGRAPDDPVPERGGARASHHRRPSPGARECQARAAELSRAAG